MIASRGVRRWGAIAICALVSAAVYAAPDPDPDLRSATTFHDFGHVVAFAVVTTVLAFAMPGHRRDGLRDRVRSAAFWAATAVVIGAAIELAQAATGGYGDPWDVVRDAGGALCAAMMWIAGDRKTAVFLRTLFAAGAVAVVTIFSVPTIRALADEARARREFPVLAAFENPQDLSRFRLREGVQATMVPLVDEEGRPAHGVRLRLPPGKYPGLSLEYFPRDWRTMQSVEVLFVNPDPAPLTVTIRIDDMDYDYRLDITDRYNHEFVLKPGPNRIEIPLADVAAAPRTRRFDLGRVKAVRMFAVDLAEPRELIVGPIVLR